MAAERVTAIIRVAGPADIPLILDSFPRDMKRSPFAHGCEPNLFRRLLSGMMRRPDWQTIIAAPDDSDEIFGWMVYRSKHEVAWMHVKGIYEHMGFASAMLAHVGVEPGPVSCAFLDPVNVPLAHKKWGLTLRYRPYLAIEGML